MFIFVWLSFSSFPILCFSLPSLIFGCISPFPSLFLLLLFHKHLSRLSRLDLLQCRSIFTADEFLSGIASLWRKSQIWQRENSAAIRDTYVTFSRRELRLTRLLAQCCVPAADMSNTPSPPPPRDGSEQYVFYLIRWVSYARHFWPLMDMWVWALL